MGEESLKKRKGEGNKKEDEQSIQSHELQTTHLQKQVNHFPFGPSVCRGLAWGRSVHRHQHAKPALVSWFSCDVLVSW